MAAAEYHVLVCDDDRALSTILSDYLCDKGFVVTLVHKAEEAQEKLLRLPYDVCLMDVHMPRPTGLAVLSAIRSASRDVPMVMLSDRLDREEALKAYELGADDYVVKPFSMDILIAKLHALVRRYRVFLSSSQTIFHLGEKVFDSVRQTLDGKHLSSRESDLLLMLCRDKNRLVDRHIILRTLWQQDDYFASRSLSVYMNHLRAYLEGTGCTIMSVHGKGYKLCD